MDRDTALEFIKEFVQGESLIRHLTAVEACMRAYAHKVGEDEELWAVAGLVHDFDWEVCPSPEDHPTYGADILRSRGFPEEIVRSMLSHGDHTDVSRDSLMEKALFACDELSGFITAVTLVRPNKSLAETKVRSVKKKMKDKTFAKSVNREDIVNGAKDLDVALDEHIEFVINALRPVASQIGLAQ